MNSSPTFTVTIKSCKGLQLLYDFVNDTNPHDKAVKLQIASIAVSNDCPGWLDKK